MGLAKEFKDFALKGNVVDMAVGIIIGVAFGALVKSVVDDVMMPPLGYLMGGVDFSDKMLVLKEKGPHPVSGKEMPAVILSYGKFINAVISFLIQALAVFILIKLINTFRKRFEKEAVAGPPPPPPADVKLLTEIRDILKQQQA